MVFLPVERPDAASVTCHISSTAESTSACRLLSPCLIQDCFLRGRLTLVCWKPRVKENSSSYGLSFRRRPRRDGHSACRLPMGEPTLSSLLSIQPSKSSGFPAARGPVAALVRRESPRSLSRGCRKRLNELE